MRQKRVTPPPQLRTNRFCNRRRLLPNRFPNRRQPVLQLCVVPGVLHWVTDNRIVAQWRYLWSLAPLLWTMMGNWQTPTLWPCGPLNPWTVVQEQDEST